MLDQEMQNEKGNVLAHPLYGWIDQKGTIICEV